MQCSPIIRATSVIFTKATQSKQSPKRRKFAQSAHPDLVPNDSGPRVCAYVHMCKF
jgi:hypothetical protein